MPSEKGLGRFRRLLLWLALIAVEIVVVFATLSAVFDRNEVRMMAWEDILTTVVGVCFLIFIPATLVRWATVPEARIEGMLGVSLVSMAVTGLSLILPVLSRGWVDSSIAFLIVVILFAAQAVISVIMHRRSDELMRRYNTDSTVIGAAVLLGGFSIYAAGERLGVIGTISPWGLVGIACILQYAVSMYVYYRLGMDPDSQEKAAR
jgi:hypothetical protein